MKFHAILIIRDEEDIIRECLESALGWCDHVYVYDTGSTDGTWEMVGEFARRDPRVVPFVRESVVFHDTIRAFVFDEFRKNMRDGDWVVRLDADELYYAAPPEFVRARLARHESQVYSQMYEFRLTEEEVANWEAGRETLADRARSIKERRRHYVKLRYSEPRMFRYRRTMQWGADASFPFNAGLIARARVPILHYPHRDPEQIRRRCELRAYVARHRSDIYEHWKPKDWRTFVVRADDPELNHWDGRSPLPECDFRNHLPAPTKRLAQRLVYAALLPALDRARPDFPASYRPVPLK
ncbi:MAG TPA: glycosyltransferase family 2 protein [Pyrinomonadaceae bacterium]|nr:glycosyltransferase family 2 protein [Pyrinomonadaceae bacterium]